MRYLNFGINFLSLLSIMMSELFDRLSYPLVLSLAIYLVYRFIVWVVLPLVFTCNSSQLGKKFNKSGKAWAVVTGTTSGIGVGFSRSLVRSGFNLMMIARNETRLKELKNELMKEKKLSGQKIEFFVVDLGTRVLSDNVTHFIANNEVSILINNAGINTEYPKMLVDNSFDEVRSIIDVNCQALVGLTRAILPGMVSRKNGCVINISSLFGQIGAPLLSVYSGTKSFIDSFSASLGSELSGSGVSVFCSLPGFVVSNMSKIRRTSLTVISADACAETVLGQAAGGWLTSAAPHWTHSLIGWLLMDLVPERIRMRILKRVNVGTNRAALKKIERVQKQA
jgi:17beta-estradiol 17-dehydrogenase / very-long-chain 3-oxoacyl-CoA reductase